MDYDDSDDGYYDSDSAYDEDMEELVTSDDEFGGTARYDAPGSSAAKVQHCCRVPLHNTCPASSSAVEDCPCSQGKFRVLDEHELKERQHEAVRSVTSVLSVSETDASRVLRLFKWYAT